MHAAHGWAWLDSWVSGGRFRPEYVVGGVVSGRWASRGGGALQIPRVLRRAVVADPGWVLVVADAAQLEPRVLAALAGDRAFAEAAASGDLYLALAGAFGGDRGKAKIALLSAMYGGAVVRPASYLPCSGSGFRWPPGMWKRRHKPVRKATWSSPCSAGPARRRPPPGGQSPRNRVTRTARAIPARAPRRAPAAGSPAISWCRQARRTGRSCCWPVCAGGWR